MPPRSAADKKRNKETSVLRETSKKLQLKRGKQKTRIIIYCREKKEKKARQWIESNKRPKNSRKKKRQNCPRNEEKDTKATNNRNWGEKKGRREEGKKGKTFFFASTNSPKAAKSLVSGESVSNPFHWCFFLLFNYFMLSHAILAYQIFQQSKPLKAFLFHDISTAELALTYSKGNCSRVQNTE